MADPTIKQNTILNSIVYEGKLLSEWIHYFRMDFNAMEDGEVIPVFLAKSSEAYHLFSKIRPHCELLESRFKRKLESSKLSIIERISSDKTKRLPNQDILDSTARLSVQIEAEKDNIIFNKDFRSVKEAEDYGNKFSTLLKPTQFL